MPHVLIAGCGYVGTATADLLHAGGWEVEGWTASASSAQALREKPYPVRAVDFAGGQNLPNETNFDLVLHCASSNGGSAEEYRRVYLGGLEQLAKAFPAARLFFTSSTSVYAQSDGEWVDETSPAEPSRETGRVLRAAEDFVLAREGVVARLAGIYGPGRSALLRKFLAGEALIDREPRFINKVHRDDIASALVCLASVGDDRSQIYNVADDEPLSQRAAYEWLAAHLHQPVPPVVERPVTRKRGPSNKRVRNAKLRAFGWEPRYPTFARAMTESILPLLPRLGA